MKTRIVSTLSLTLLLSASHMVHAMQQSGKRKNRSYVHATQNRITEGPTTHLDHLKEQVPPLVKEIARLTDTLKNLNAQKIGTNDQIQRLTVTSSKSLAQAGRHPGVIHNTASQLQPLETLYTRTMNSIEDNETQLTARQADLARVSRDIHVEAMKPSFAQITSETAPTLNHELEHYMYPYTIFAKTLAVIPHMNHNGYKECPVVTRTGYIWNLSLLGNIVKGKKLNKVDKGIVVVATSKNKDTLKKLNAQLQEHAAMNKLYNGYNAKYLALLAQVKDTTSAELHPAKPMLFRNLSAKAYQGAFTGISKAGEQHATQIALYNDLVLEFMTSGIEEIPAFVPAAQTPNASPTAVAASPDAAAQQPHDEDGDMVKVDPASSSSTAAPASTTSGGWSSLLNWFPGSTKK